LLKAAGMARSTFYYHFRKSKQPDKYAREKESIIRLYHEHKGRYGYRRITVEMNKIGYAINHKTVLKLMNICGIKSQVRLRKYCSYKGQIGRIAPNLLQRDFAAEKPNQKWVTDLTFYPANIHQLKYGFVIYRISDLIHFNGNAPITITPLMFVI
jgi:transposase InsO family protein